VGKTQQLSTATYTKAFSKATVIIQKSNIQAPPKTASQTQTIQTQFLSKTQKKPKKTYLRLIPITLLSSKMKRKAMILMK